LTGQIKSFEDLSENDNRRLYPRFQPHVFDENMKLVKEVEKIAQGKGCTVGFHVRVWYGMFIRELTMVIAGPSRYRMGEYDESKTWNASDHTTSWCYDRGKS
jgi:aryl-alcohol dehydrogenase-like predicted oxidoreductase